MIIMNIRITQNKEFPLSNKKKKKKKNIKFTAAYPNTGA